MFKNKLTESTDIAKAASTSIIGNTTTITGNIHTNGDIRIDGNVKGNLEGIAKIIIGANGTILGDIMGKQADIYGKVTGTIKVAELLTIYSKAIVNGDVYAGKLQIEATAIFNGQCNMGASLPSIDVLGELKNE